MRARQTGLTKGGVLLMGGDSGLQQSVRAALEAENYEVIPAASRDEAQERFDAESIDILVMDVDQKPEGLGPLLAQFRAQRPHLRANGIRGPRKQAVQVRLAGVNVWMEKPLGPTRLVATVNHLLAELRSEAFRQELLRRQSAPLFRAEPQRHWGLNE
jgi:DNA-binding response OmpR family regulator